MVCQHHMGAHTVVKLITTSKQGSCSRFPKTWCISHIGCQCLHANLQRRFPSRYRLQMKNFRWYSRKLVEKQIESLQSTLQTWVSENGLFLILYWCHPFPIQVKLLLYNPLSIWSFLHLKLPCIFIYTKIYFCILASLNYFSIPILITLIDNIYLTWALLYFDTA